MYLKLVKYFLFLLGVIPIWNIAQAELPQQLFNQGNQMYEREAYDSALTKYSQIIDEGYHNTDLFFNAGNASYKLGKAGYAIYYFTKALQTRPGDKKISHNLQLAQIKAFNKTKHLPTIFLVRWWHAFLQFLNANTWLILSLVFFWIFLFFLGWSILSNQTPKAVRKLKVFSGILFGIFFIGAVFSLNTQQNHDAAIIVLPESDLMDAPDQLSNDIQSLQEGIKVKILDHVNDWTKIQLKDGTEGWLNSEEVKAL